MAGSKLGSRAGAEISSKFASNPSKSKSSKPKDSISLLILACRFLLRLASGSVTTGILIDQIIFFLINSMIHHDTTHMVTQSYLKQTSFHLYPLVEASWVMLS